LQYAAGEQVEQLSGLANESGAASIFQDTVLAMKNSSLPASEIDPALRDARWLFFDMGNTLISEEASTTYRIERICRCLQPA
jgi:hypothetical protein